jgi:hypothetical protein
MWCTKNAFCRAENAFLPNPPIHLVWYIRNIFEDLEGSICVFHLKSELHSCPSYLIQSLSPHKFRPTCSSVVGCNHVWCLKYKHVYYFEDLNSRWKSIGNIMIICFNRFCRCTKNAFWRAENPFFTNAPIHLVWYIRNVVYCLEDSKKNFHLKYDLHSKFHYLFQKISPPKFRKTYSSLVGRRQV